MADTGQVREVRAAAGVGHGQRRLEPVDRRIEQLLRRQRLPGDDLARRILLRDRHAGAICLGEEDERVALEAQRLGVRRVRRGKLLVRALCSERRLPRGLRVEVDAEHRRVVAIDRSPVDLNARWERFSKEKFVGEKAGHVDETFGADRGPGERHLKIANGRGEQRR